MVRRVQCRSVTGHPELVFLTGILARLRSGDMWYAKLFRKILRTVMWINPNIILNQIVKGTTPNFADEAFMREFR